MVAGARIHQARCQDLDAPGGQAHHVVGGDVEIGRVFQGDVVQREVGAVIDLQQPWHVLAQALGDVEIGQIPPAGLAGIRSRGERAATAAVDLAGAHDGALGSVGDVDQRVAGLGLVGGGGAAGAQAIVVILRIARAEQGHAAIDPQRHAALDGERAAQQAGFSAIADHQTHRAAGRAIVDGGLQACGVAFGLGGILVERIQRAGNRHQRSLERCADLAGERGLLHDTPTGGDAVRGIGNV